MADATLKPHALVEYLKTDATLKPHVLAEYLKTDATMQPKLLVDYDKFSVDVNFSLDIKRHIYWTDSFKSDIKRKIIVNVALTQTEDVKRILSNPDSFSGDIKRYLYVDDAFLADVKRLLGRIVENVEDIRRIIPRKIITHLNGGTGVNVQNINITLKSATLSDTFELSTPLELSVGERITGSILDFTFIYDVESTAKQDAIQTVNGMTDCDSLLYSIYNYGDTETFQFTTSAGETMTATPSIKGSSALKRFAKAVGKSASVYMDDFYCKENTSGQTYQSFISTLFGWSGQAPTLLINVFLRGDTLYAVQRGHEPNALDLTDCKHTRPQVSREIVRTVYQEDVTSMHQPFWAWLVYDWQDDEELYPSKTVTEEPPKAEGHTVTKTIESGNVSEVIDVADDGTETRTYYHYSGTGKDPNAKLEKQVEETTDKNGNKTTASTYYDYNNHYGYVEARKYRDGELSGSAVAQGEGGTPSRYARQKELSRKQRIPKTLEWKDLNAEKAKKKSNGSERNLDYKTYIHLQCELKRLNRKIKETVSFDVYNLSHIVDFTDAITFNGNRYYLESNKTSLTPTEFKQSLELVRWYGTGTTCTSEDEAAIVSDFEKVMKLNKYEYIDGSWVYTG